MAERKNSRDTRRRLLEAACEVFAEKGFRDAKITTICKRAGANVAGVNYHFGDKASLYVSAWRKAMEQFILSDPPIPADLPPEAQLRFRIRSILRSLLDSSGAGHFYRMELMELANPTGLIDETARQVIAPRRKELIRVIRELAGPDVSDREILLCERSVINLCRGFKFLKGDELEKIAGHPPDSEKLEKLTDFITRFAIAGIRTVREDSDS